MEYMVLSKDQQRDLIRGQVGGFEMEYYNNSIAMTVAMAQPDDDNKKAAVASLQNNLDRLERNINATRGLLAEFDANNAQAAE